MEQIDTENRAYMLDKYALVPVAGIIQWNYEIGQIIVFPDNYLVVILHFVGPRFEKRKDETFLFVDLRTSVIIAKKVNPTEEDLNEQIRELESMFTQNIGLNKLQDELIKIQTSSEAKLGKKPKEYILEDIDTVRNKTLIRRILGNQPGGKHESMEDN